MSRLDNSVVTGLLSANSLILVIYFELLKPYSHDYQNT